MGRAEKRRRRVLRTKWKQGNKLQEHLIVTQYGIRIGNKCSLQLQKKFLYTAGIKDKKSLDFGEHLGHDQQDS